MRFDTINKNGVLEGDEALALARWQLGDEAEQDDVEQLVATIDTNANGQIAFKEYMAWLLGAGWSVEEDAVTEEPRTTYKTSDSFITSPPSSANCRRSE